MRTSSLERYAPLTGVLAILLWLIGFAIFEVVGDTPESDATPQDFLTYFGEEEGSIFGGSFVFALGSLAFIWFVGTLRAALATAEGAPGRVSGIAFAGGIGTFLFSLAVVMGQLGGVFAADEANFAPEAAQALWYAYDGLFVASGFTSLVVALGTGLVILRTGVLQRWWGWVSLLVALGLLIYPVIWVSILFVFPAWVIVTSVLLYSRQAAAGAAETAPVASTAVE